MRDKYPDRIIADVTPDYLLDLYKDRMTILGDRDTEPFIGKWFILSGKIADVSAVGPSARIGIYIQFKLADPPRQCSSTIYGMIAYLFFFLGKSF
jgi:hypothetical protein